VAFVVSCGGWPEGDGNKIRKLKGGPQQKALKLADGIRRR